MAKEQPEAHSLFLASAENGMGHFQLSFRRRFQEGSGSRRPNSKDMDFRHARSVCRASERNFHTNECGLVLGSLGEAVQELSKLLRIRKGMMVGRDDRQRF